MVRTVCTAVHLQAPLSEGEGGGGGGDFEFAARC